MPSTAAAPSGTETASPAARTIPAWSRTPWTDASAVVAETIPPSTATWTVLSVDTRICSRPIDWERDADVLAPSARGPRALMSSPTVLAVVTKKNVSALYSEPQLDPRPAKIIADEAKIPLGVLDPVGGQPETDSYEKMIRFDVSALEKHLK